MRWALKICSSISSSRGSIVYLSVPNSIPMVESPCGIVVNVLDYDFVVSEFKLQSCYYIHFWTNNLGKGINSLIPPAIS